MDARERHSRLRSLFLHARGLEGSARAAFVAEACAEDPDLREELERLLASDAAPAPLPDPGEVRRDLEDLHARCARSADAPFPEAIGDYRIVGALGQGGMGIVYEALQERLGRTVALKVLRPGLLTAQASRRFEFEAAVLARLQHPGIARIYDSGEEPSDLGPRPWFAMELVTGQPLTRYADAHGLGLRARVELLARVADAVQHAHRHGVIHRDLKPDNVLVDAAGSPKILDFGIARASDADLQSVTRQTDAGQVLGTLAYMSPEQASGDPDRVDTRTDVYALGVVLYELVAGRLPYELSDTSLPEALRVVQEVEPRRLSAVRSTLRGDVETIVRTALEKDRERRYPSAEALAADLRRFLADEPILARPASALYAARKFVRRNRVAATAASLVLLSLAAGLFVSLRFGLREAERRREVLQLSALQDLEELVAEADGDALWPLDPEKMPTWVDWIRRAEDLVSRRERFLALRDDLRERAALPESPGSPRRSPFTEDLAELGARITSQRRTLAQVRDGEVAVLPPLGDYASLPADRLHALAFEYSHPLRRVHGREDLGLSLARAAHAASGGSPETGDTLAWACVTLGRLAEAEEVDARADATLDRVPAHTRKYLDRSRFLRTGTVRAMREPGWIERQEKDLANLERRRADLAERDRAWRTWEFPPEAANEAWWHGQLIRLVEGLHALESGLLAEDAVTPEHGWSVPLRLRVTRSWEGPELDLAGRWAAALPAIRDAYPGLDLAPQVGLLPLGPDPDSKLWEFAHLGSGQPAERDSHGRLTFGEESGLVLVLLPGGVFRMGAHTDPDDPVLYDSEASRYSLPVHTVELSPFFLSKYEMTQGQWLRLTGENPSRDRPGGYLTEWNAEGRPGDLTLPVDQVSWEVCTQVCQRFGLALPSEAQWEYAARAGTVTPWWTGAEPGSLEGAANVADVFASKHDQELRWIAYEAWDDGHKVSAHVGSYAPNGFGLHDMLGNVQEWCRDTYDPLLYMRPYSVDPVGTAGNRGLRMVRGGNFTESTRRVRVGRREVSAPGTIEFLTGLRPAREVER